MSLVVSNIYKSINDKLIVNDVSFKVMSGELVAILGPSGSGKTSVLRIISGLMQQDQGSIYMNGQNIDDLPVQQRKIGFVFQNYSLFPHMNVFDNVAFGLRTQFKLVPEEILSKVTDLLTTLQINNLIYRKVDTLSGGQAQRVAIARALAVNPKIILFDEPFGALDSKIRAGLRKWLRDLHDQFHITGVIVTHDQEEAAEIADKIIIMNKGRIEAIGTPDELYRYKDNNFVYDFLGSYNIFPGYQDQEGNISIGEYYNINGMISHPNTKNKKQYAKILFKKLLPFKQHKLSQTSYSKIVIHARYHDMILSHNIEHKTLPYIQSRITKIQNLGNAVLISLVYDNEQLFYAQLPHHIFDPLNLKENDTCFAYPAIRTVKTQDDNE